MKSLLITACALCLLVFPKLAICDSMDVGVQNADGTQASDAADADRREPVIQHSTGVDEYEAEPETENESWRLSLKNKIKRMDEYEDDAPYVEDEAVDENVDDQYEDSDLPYDNSDETDDYEDEPYDDGY